VRAAADISRRYGARLEAEATSAAKH